ncbi:hypothetical protein V2J09_002070 [Rumex salicifolius]
MKTEMEPEEDEDEDGDVDFNPFLRGSPAEASSSLSSDIEGLDLDVIVVEGAQPLKADTSLNQADINYDSAVDNSQQIDEGMTRKRVNFEEHHEQEQEEAATINSKKGKISVPEKDVSLEKKNGSESEAGNNVTMEGSAVCRPATTSDDEDAICRRTRARYSLASFTLDELETFLQETDDDDDLPNVDDEEEYRKFLAAVLQGGHNDGQALLDNGNDEDEDNDADFEIEIEEALESDVDDCLVEKAKPKGPTRRPETRQNRRHKASSEGKKKLMEHEKRPLRPLLPILPTTLIPSIPSNLMVETPPNSTPPGNNHPLYGFTPHQMGQLYCLIHEHVQLLIQVFSLCVLDPSRRNIATQAQGLLSEMLNKRDRVLAWRDVPHPSFCFQSPYIHPSIVDEHLKCLPLEKSVQPYDMNDKERGISSLNSKSQGSPDLQSCNANGHATKEIFETVQIVQGSSWLPIVGSPVLSILDVPPLKFVGKYMDDVSTAVQQQMRRYVEATTDLNSEKQPLFPLPLCLSFANCSAATANGGAPASPEFSTVASSSPNHRPAKKTLAASLVESSKKQSVALVPKRIAELSRQFYQLFNPALFPHKPPPLAVANRVLFTDAEDELLAMGLMEYNTDWKAIQQRFLPCKSKHQIFVRQKNRCSSKAPDNPIKEVRKLKTSPLTEEEKARISEGLTAFKLDWMSIWKFIVPYRDPSLLPRQWRTALGMQKSYKKVDPTMREKRRIYEWNRRRSKIIAAENLPASDKEDEQPGVHNENGEECTENNDEAYVHEAFLADWRPAPSVTISEISTSNLNSRCLPTSAEECQPIRQPPYSRGSHDSQTRRDHYASEFTVVSGYSQKAGYGIPRPFSAGPNCSTSTSAMNPSTYVCYSRPYRARKRRNTQLVRLAPSLPPVNLPSTVRVIPQAAFQNSHHGTPNQTAGACSGSRDITASRPNHVVNSSTGLSNVTRKRSDIAPSCSREAQLSKDQSADQENGFDSDLQMHPLLFQAPGNGRLPYYPAAPNSFSFFPMTPHQVKIPTFQNSIQPKALVDQTTSKKTSSVSLDFHPLLQRIDNVNNGCRSSRLATNLQPSRGTSSRVGATNELDLEINLNSAPRKEKDLVFDGSEVLTPSICGYIGFKDSADDQSLPEIVMEQEELSDSDEEVEHVEFEREEMADSEGEDEEPYTHQILNAQNQQQTDTTLNLDDPDNRCELAAHVNPETPLVTGLSVSGQDVVRSPWLSLNSHARVSNSNAYLSSNLDSSVVSHSIMSRQNLNPGPAKTIAASTAPVISRSPRKRVSKVSSSLNMDVGNSSCRKNSED